MGFLLSKLDGWKQDLERRTKLEIREVIQCHNVSSAQLDRLKDKNVMLEMEVYCLQGRG